MKENIMKERGNKRKGNEVIIVMDDEDMKGERKEEIKRSERMESKDKGRMEEWRENWNKLLYEEVKGNVWKVDERNELGSIEKVV